MSPVALSLGAQQPGHETDHTPPSSAKAKNEHSHTVLLHMTSWHAKGKVYFTFIIF
jgi:hypothetical protein